VPLRRTFLKQALVTGAVAGCAGWSAGLAAPALSRSGAVCGLKWYEETIFRLPGMGDGYKMTWAAEGRQFIVQNDGTGWTDNPTRFFKRSLWTMEGPPGAVLLSGVPGYPNTEHVAGPDDDPDYHGHGLLAVNGRLYQFLGALDRAQGRLRRWNAAKLIYSDDDGRTWRNQDGSTPVHEENWVEQSRGTLVFHNEHDGCFSLLSFLQMGQEYRANRDGYIYVYSPNGNTDGRMNELVMLRVPVAGLLDRSAYEFFAGHTSDGTAVWRREIAARRPVHVFPRGWVNCTSLFDQDIVVETWLPSLAYNAELGIYMMVSAGTGCAPDGTEFARPSYLGFGVSDTPWGPWRQIHEDLAWVAGGDPASRPYSPQIAPGWIAPDGASLWLVWADLKGIRSPGAPDVATDAHASAPMHDSSITPLGPLADVDMMRRAMPLLRLNGQRIDLKIR